MLKHMFLGLCCAAAWGQEAPKIQPTPTNIDDLQIISPISSRKPLLYLDKDGTWTAYYDDKVRKLDARKPVTIINGPEIPKQTVIHEKTVIREKVVVTEKKEVIVVHVPEPRVQIREEVRSDPVRHSQSAREALQLSLRAEEACHAAQRFMEDRIRQEKAERNTESSFIRKSDRQVHLSRTVGPDERETEIRRRVETERKDCLSSDQEEIPEDEEDGE